MASFNQLIDLMTSPADHAVNEPSGSMNKHGIKWAFFHFLWAGNGGGWEGRWEGRWEGGKEAKKVGGKVRRWEGI